MRAKLTIDGKTQLDSDLTEWQQRPPEFLAKLINPTHKPQPYIQAAALALVEAKAKNMPITINIDTTPAGWTMNVTHTPAIEP